MKLFTWLKDNPKKAVAALLLVTGVALSVFYPPFAGFLTPYLPAAAAGYAASISAVLAAFAPVTAFGLLVGAGKLVVSVGSYVSNLFSGKKAPVNNSEPANSANPEATATTTATSNAEEPNNGAQAKTEPAAEPAFHNNPVNAGDEVKKKAESPKAETSEENSANAVNP